MGYSVMWILAAQISVLLCLVYTDQGIATGDDIDIYQKEVVPRILLDKDEEITTEEDIDMHQKEVEPRIFFDKVQLPRLIQGEPVLNPRGRRPLPHVSRSNLEDFPPGRPSQANIDNICRKNRTIVSYGPHNLPQTGFGHLSRQGRAINDLEEGFTKCCLQPEPLRCAKTTWEKVLSTFCEEEVGFKTAPYVCCKNHDPSLLHRCFANMAPFPEYDQEVEILDLGAMTNDTLEKLCGDYKLHTKTTHVPQLVSGLRDSCCTLPQDRKLGCAEDQKKKHMKNFCCPTRESRRDGQDCCNKSAQERDGCFSHYLQNVTVSIPQRKKGE